MGMVAGLVVNWRGQYRTKSVMLAGMASIVFVGAGLVLFHKRAEI